MWTRFMDMHSGGSLKEPWQYIYVEAPEAEAHVIFYNRFGHSHNRVSCTCCGEDYVTYEHETLREATAYERNCHYAYFFEDETEAPDIHPTYNHEQQTWMIDGRPVKGQYVERSNRYRKHIPLEEYLQSKDIHVIRAEDIKPSEREGVVPEQGYVWKD